MALFLGFLQKLFFWRKRNTRFTPQKTIISQMNEPRPLPMGRTEFAEWSDRILSGALIPGATRESQKFALADAILHLGPTESHKPDAFFIHMLRKCAVNEVADTMRKEIREEGKKRLEEETKKQEEIKAKSENKGAGQALPTPTVANEKILAKQQV